MSSVLLTALRPAGLVAGAGVFLRLETMGEDHGDDSGEWPVGAARRVRVMAFDGAGEEAGEGEGGGGFLAILFLGRLTGSSEHSDEPEDD